MASYLGITSRVLGKQLSISWIMYFMQCINSAQNKVCNQCPLNFVRINLSLTFLAFTSVSRAMFHITQLNSFCIRRSTSIKKLRSLLVLVPFQWGLSVFWRASMWSRHEHFSMPCLSDHLNQRYQLWLAKAEKGRGLSETRSYRIVIITVAQQTYFYIDQSLLSCILFFPHGSTASSEMIKS